MTDTVEGLRDPADAAVAGAIEVAVAVEFAVAAVQPTAPMPSDVPLLPDDPGDHVLRCTAVRRETGNVLTFVFEPADGAGFRWAPGQYLTLNTGLDGADATRCYTISSACTPPGGPGSPGELEITLKLLPGGPVSTLLHETLRPGSLLGVYGPLGEFTPAGLDDGQPAPAPSPKYLFLAAGSGITPLMAHTRALLARAPGGGHDVVLLNSVRTPGDLIFARELGAIDPSSGIRVEVLCSTGAAPGMHGRLDADLLRALVPDLTEREVFACGPAGYLEAVRTMLDDAGADPRRRHEESFDLGTRDTGTGSPAPGTPAAADPAEANPAEADPAASNSTGFTVEFARSGRSITCPSDCFVLDAALAAGIPVPSSCTLGMCGTCKSDLVSGTVDMNHAGGIRPKEIAAGKILICCSKPTGDLVIDA